MILINRAKTHIAVCKAIGIDPARSDRVVIETGGAYPTVTITRCLTVDEGNALAEVLSKHHLAVAMDAEEKAA